MLKSCLRLGPRPGRRCLQACLTSATRYHSSAAAQPTKKSYYNLFPATFPKGGPPHGPFTIPKAQLKTEYLRLQAAAHPDKIGPSGSDEERAASENRSSLISVAYQTLLSPLRRAQHILESRTDQHGMDRDPLAEDAGQQGGAISDEDFLMEVLLARESIEEASSAQELNELLRENDEKIAATVEQLDEAFAKDDLDLATTLTQKLSYWEGIDRQIQETIEEYE